MSVDQINVNARRFSVAFKSSGLCGPETDVVYSEKMNFEGIHFHIRIVKSGVSLPILTAHFTILNWKKDITAKFTVMRRLPSKFENVTPPFLSEYMDGEQWTKNVASKDILQSFSCDSLLKEPSASLVDGNLVYEIEVIAQASLFNNIVTQLTVQLPSMLFDRATSDCVIVTHNESFPVHKLILGLASPVFKAMFESQMQETFANEIVITDFSEETVRIFLSCIYNSNDMNTLAKEHVLPLLLMANKYDCSAIETVAKRFIIQSIGTDNVVDTLLFADQYDIAEIKSAAMDFIVENAPYFLRQPDFHSTLLRCDERLLTEFHTQLADCLEAVQSVPTRQDPLSPVIKEGSKVEGNYRGKGKWYPGKVRQIHSNGTIDINYDDGESETRMEPQWVRLAMSVEHLCGTSVQANPRAKGYWFPGKVKDLSECEDPWN